MNSTHRKNENRHLPFFNFPEMNVHKIIPTNGIVGDQT